MNKKKSTFYVGSSGRPRPVNWQTSETSRLKDSSTFKLFDLLLLLIFLQTTLTLIVYPLTNPLKIDKNFEKGSEDLLVRYNQENWPTGMQEKIKSREGHLLPNEDISKKTVKIFNSV